MSGFKKKFPVFQQFPKKLFLPILPRGCRPNWDINPIFSIHLFYLNSCVLFQLLFTPTTGYRFMFLSNASLYIIPLSVYTTKTCNKLNCFLKMCKKNVPCKACILIQNRVSFEAENVLVLTSQQFFRELIPHSPMCATDMTGNYFYYMFLSKLAT